ncbi:response regulator [Sorangium cellulosum]|uniref:response regulator n=1 Tax=Sorangium cellulosum TaxID=56 RepID=UPI000B0B3429|nr:response regulator transcription factor [Sorangium cellulosum]
MAETPASVLRIYLIHDHPIVREGFARALSDEPDIVVVGQAGAAADALRETASCKPDVVLVDLDVPDRDGIELLGALRAQLPQATLLVLSGYGDESRVAEALRAGAQGHLVKTSKLEDIIDGVRRIATGGAPLSTSIAAAAVRAMRKRGGKPG